MDMNMKQNIQQEQRLLLTSDMKLSLQLLQMPIDDLQECIEKELNENPLLEIDYSNSDLNEDTDNADIKKEEEPFFYEKYIQNNKYDNYGGEIIYHDSDDDYDNNPFNYISQTATLKDYLKEQLMERDENEEILNICASLIEFINEDGLIPEEIKDISQLISKPYQMVFEASEILKDFQPWGIGAKDFRESLMIQLKKQNKYNEKLEEIIMKHLELLGDNKIKELAKILDDTVANVQNYVNIIKTLEPKPARGFYTGEATQYIIPEAFLKKIGNEYYIIMNDDLLPKLNVNSYYQRILKENKNQETVSFMKDKISSALAFIKGIEQRRNTIYRIIEKITEYQKAYFDKGEAYLRPMNMKELAIDLNLHESTVSRAVKDKFISVPAGTIRLRDLFTNGINSGTKEENISSNVIKKEINRVVEAEDKLNPLSDQAIYELLKNLNMNISRRTVAKYREELGIRSSAKRKVYSN
ncbi:RNA polymerase factor sigma-54 [Anaerocolumna chitinilytica]|uniref:RNA polymerase sigma-54 factor n=1 Tax=Anaerocolumna chitinilytica TaxID=1727145 RepID=A0A7I8DM93_9FIRM|nr:RNA polymerase factor sigma-54 [Anaerocolumna chitinilytica]BCJ98444.1 RNA polymerase sigma-54 factor [Anaerocolumna chitinilytica]